MALKIINGVHVYHAFVAGAKKIIQQKSLLNSINVFPVPDGDTGTNMAAMMQRIINDAVITEHLGDALESISSAAISGSRGNSGIIFSEYLNGIYEKLQGVKEADITLFHQAVLYGIKKAYAAIQNPVEGTILTVFRKAFTMTPEIDDFVTYFSTIKIQAEVALAETSKELEVLRLNKVVDAGAQGLASFIDGITYYFTNGIEDALIEQSDEVSFDHHHHDELITERYCTEVLLKDCSKNTLEVKTLLSKYGTSLVVSGRPSKMRVHIHTNDPSQIVFELRNVGEIIEQKVDDMIRQNQTLGPDHPRIAIVTDSIADFPLAMADQYHVHMIPMYLIADDISYLDKLTITATTFYKLMDISKTLSSSQPDKLTIERNLSALLEHYDHILVITVASRLSGTYNAMTQFAKLHPKIVVFDSKQNSGAQGLVVLKACRLIEEGKTITEITPLLEDFTKRTKIYVSVKTLKYMVKMGRVSKVTGLIGKMINLKPVIGLSPEGAGVISAKAFSLRGNVKQIMRLIGKEEVESYAMVHSLAAERAHKLAKLIEKKTGKKPLYTELISPIVAMNAGIGAVAVAVTFKKEVEHA